jgi:hypothetical protein
MLNWYLTPKQKEIAVLRILQTLKMILNFSKT